MYDICPFQFVRQDQNTISVSRMEFHPKASDNRKNVTCRAENTNIKGSAIEDTIPLDVHCKCLFNDFVWFG